MDLVERERMAYSKRTNLTELYLSLDCFLSCCWRASKPILNAEASPGLGFYIANLVSLSLYLV